LLVLRIDVDYPYPSRIRSFLYTALNLRAGSDYLKNSRIVARMINDSPREVKAYWFFTPKTIPDKELLALMSNSKHEVALHIVNDPNKELRLLKESTGREINYYTFHGTARLLARIMWKRFKAKTPAVPSDFSLQSFHQFPKIGLDSLCYTCPTRQSIKIAEAEIAKNHVIHIHPIWLFQRGKMNHRGPYYEAFRNILNVDADLQTVSSRRKNFLEIARDEEEYEKDVVPTERLIERLSERGIDIFTFLERKWCHTIRNPPASWSKANENFALLKTTSYDDWWKNIGKKTRNMIRKAEKSGVRTEIAEPNASLAKGMWEISNETPIRQGRAFPHYGISLETITKGLASIKNATYIGAYLQDELVGFVQLIHGDRITMISQILSLQKHWDKAVNNALVAKTVEFCANSHREWVMYGRMGNHPTLDDFKQNNGFSQFQLTRYYIALTRKGRIATKLGLHRELKDALPQAMKRPLFPLYNWISRTRIRVRLKLRPKQIF
jgi:hypothetical protein